MAKRKGRKYGRRGAGITIDMTEAKLFGQLFSKYNGPATVKKALNKDASGALTEWGKGEPLDTVFQALPVGFAAMIRRKAKMYVEPIKSRWGKIRG